MTALLFLAPLLPATDNPEIAKAIDEVYNFAFKERYSAAFALTNQLIGNHPAHPAGYLLKAAILDYWMNDFQTSVKEKQFYGNLDEAIKRATAQIRTTSGRAKGWAYFYRGSSYAFKAFRLGRKGNNIQALAESQDAVDDLERALELDSTLYDCYFPLGVYDYSMSNLPRSVSWMPFITNKGGREEEGFRKVKIAVEKGLFTRTIAEYTLCLLYLERGDIKGVKEAHSIAKSLVARYPESRTFRWVLGRAQRRQSLWREGEKNYEVLFYLVLRDQISVNYNVLTSCYWLAHGKFFNRKYDQAVAYFDFALGVIRDAPKRTDYYKRLEKQAAQMKRKAQKQLAKADGG